MPMVFRMNIWYHIIMEIINLKTVSPETRKIIKKQVIRISSAYKKEGTACLREKKRGREFGEKCQLTPVQEKEIRRIRIDKSPDQMKLSFMLWTRAVARRLKIRRYCVEESWEIKTYYC